MINEIMWITGALKRNAHEQNEQIAILVQCEVLSSAAFFYYSVNDSVNNP